MLVNAVWSAAKGKMLCFLQVIVIGINVCSDSGLQILKKACITLMLIFKEVSVAC
jgi:hypothetical protein